MLPIEFTESLKETGLDAAGQQALCRALDETEPPVSIRFNPYKLGAKPEGEQVPWSRYGFYLPNRPQFTLDPLFHGGAYYVQEASSMFIEHVFRQLFPDGERLRILDLCAAPGGKTTLLSTVAGLESTVVANEVIRARALTLADNVRKWGLGNVSVTNNDPSHFAGFSHWFDMIAVDAPCSGEGMFRKDPKAREEWSPQAVELCAARQRRILADVWDALKPGGYLVYSTCTFNRRENEENIEWLLNEYDCEGVEIPTDPAWGIVRSEVAVPEQAETGDPLLCGAAGLKGFTDGTDDEESPVPISVFRFYPHLVRGEGFCCAVIRKGGGKVRTKTPKPRKAIFTELSKQDAAGVAPWFNQPEFMHFAGIGDLIYGYYNAAYPDVRALAENLTVLYSGVLAGQLFHGKLKPEHPLAMFHDLNREAAPETDLDEETVLDYLRKNEIAPDAFAEGTNLVCYDSLPLGWVKRIGHRVNNLYPKELRIMNL